MKLPLLQISTVIDLRLSKSHFLINKRLAYLTRSIHIKVFVFLKYLKEFSIAISLEGKFTVTYYRIVVKKN